MTDKVAFISGILKSLLAIAPFVLLCFGARKVNLKKPIRNRQFLMPVFALIYVIMLLIMMDKLNTKLLEIIKMIPVWVNTAMSWLPVSTAELISPVVQSALDFLNSLNIKYWLFFISNTVAILAYFAFKGACLAFLKSRFKKPSNLHDVVSGKFYEFFPERDVWCILNNRVQTRNLFKVVYYTTVFLSATVMIVTARMYDYGLLATVFYPVVGIVLIGELYFYLDGVTKAEYSKDILGEDEDAYKTVNYSLLRKYLRNIFTDKLLCENTGVNNALTYTVTNEEILEKLHNDTDQKVVNFATYYSALNKAGFQLDHNYLASSLDLLKGKSVIFNNPFYQDLIPYAFYPMNRALLSQKKVLIILGRHAIEDDISAWVKDGIEAVTNIPFMWRTGVLDETQQELDIGIVTRSKVIDAMVHEANAEFLKQVGYVVVIEPSKLVSTAQIGLNLLIKKCIGHNEDKKITYCMCDRNCDGLVDAMSHILMSSFTEVSATNKHLGTSSYMCWDSDNEYMHHRMLPNIARYLGFGTELSFAALKNQVSNTYWYGGDAFPVTDIRWIARQYYYELMKYSALPTSQEAMNDYFHTSPNMWSAGIRKNNYFTVEDESYNMFEILRNFATRSTEQGFINVVSSNYLLKDYMSANDSIFEADAKAIPYLVADYARTHRNVILRLMLLMSISKIDDVAVRKEFSLIGLPALNTRKQLWFEIYKCLSDIDVIQALPEDYRQAVREVTERSIMSKDETHEFKIDIIKSQERYNYEMGCMETVYSISDYRFIDMFVNELKSSSYVAEDEKGDRYFLGSELSGHIYQKYLPGQFFTFDGKYYEMQYLTTDNQVLVRRAADHIHGRPAYRQLRKYTITAVAPSEQIGAIKEVDGIKITKEYADISVDTQGYYRMDKYNDFSTAKKILFRESRNGIPQRSYKYKKMLRIDLPDDQGGYSPEVRYTITVLLNEVFRTLFADNQPYIVAVTDDSHIKEDAQCKPLTYSLSGDESTVCKNSIYIIEDSQIDIGLLITVERNLKRIFEIIHDYLVWNKREIARSLRPKPEPQPVVIPEGATGETPQPKQKKDNIFKRMGRAIKKFFKKIFSVFKRKKKTDSVEPTVDTEKDNKPVVEDPSVNGVAVEPENIPQPEVDPTLETDNNEAQTEPVETETQPQPADPQQSATENDTQPEDPQPESTEVESQTSDPQPVANMPATSQQDTVATIEKEKKDPFDFTRTPYHKRYYLLYGYTGEPETLDLNSTLDYLTTLGFDNNPMKKARDGRRIAKYVEATFKPNKKNARYCDFCGNEIFGVEYETLADGRDRCISCSRTAIKTEEEFKRIFEDVKRNMEAFFGIKINTGIKVEMVNSQKLHKRLKQAFVPTPQFDGRVLGVAIKDKNGYTLMIENGSPRISSMLTIAHELTHIWQYLNWNDKLIRRTYGNKMRLEIYEGMAKWVEIQYAYLINEPSVAKREEIYTVARGDEYGNGYIRYRANYPLTTGTVITRDTPFMNTVTPLDPMYCGDVSVMIDPNNGARGYDDDDDDLDDGFDDFDDEPNIEKKEFSDTRLRNPDKVSLYAYQQLSAQEQELYNLFYNAIANFETQIADIPQWATQSDIIKMRNYVLRDHPEIFWFNGSVNFYFEKDTGKIIRCELPYCMARADAQRRNDEIEVAVQDFLSGITADMSDYDVALAVYNNIIDLVDYDSLKLDSVGDKVADDVPDDLRSIYGVFVEKKAVCAGYAKAIQYLFNRLGIECTYVTGEAERGPHAWNLVQLSSEYYHLDVTWDDHSNTKESENESNEITYDYFCVTTEDILRDHTPDDILPLPECKSRQCNYYYRNGTLVDEYSFANVRTIVKDSVANGKYDISFKASSKKVYRSMYDSLIRNKKIGDIIQYLCLDSTTRVSTSYAYSYSNEKLKITIKLSKI